MNLKEYEKDLRHQVATHEDDRIRILWTENRISALIKMAHSYAEMSGKEFMAREGDAIDTIENDLNMALGLVGEKPIKTANTRGFGIRPIGIEGVVGEEHFNDDGDSMMIITGIRDDHPQKVTKIVFEEE